MAGKALMNSFQHSFHLARVLGDLQGVLFMKAGDTMHEFCVALFDRTARRQLWRSDAELTGLFHDAAAATGRQRLATLFVNPRVFFLCS